MTPREKTTRFILHWIGPGKSTNYVSQKAVDDIRRDHINNRHFADIGYHYLIDRNGKLYKGRDENRQGAHALDHNSDSIGINLMYGTEDETVTDASLQKLVELLAGLCQKYKIVPHRKTIIGHKDVCSTVCPGIIYPHIKEIIQSVDDKLDSTFSVSEVVPEREISKIKIFGKDGKEYEGMLINSQSYIHIPFVADMLNATYKWDPVNKSVTFQ